MNSETKFDICIFLLFIVFLASLCWGLQDYKKNQKEEHPKKEERKMNISTLPVGMPLGGGLYLN